MPDYQLAAAILQRDFPDLTAKTITVLGNGWNNIAYLVNDSLVFRMPTDRDGTGVSRRRKVKAEVALLREVHGRLPVATPLPQHIAPDFSYFGYGHIAGTALGEPPEPYETPLQAAAFMQLWIDVAARVASLIEPERALEIGVEPFRDIESRLASVEYALNSNLLSDSVGDLARLCMDEYLARYERAAPHAVTMHADMGSGNWLTDDDGNVTALVDWTDACIAPPEHQLAYWPYERSHTRVEEAVRRYAGTTGYQPDMWLVYLGFFANVIGDTGVLLREGKQMTDPEIQQGLALAEFWAQELP